MNDDDTMDVLDIVEIVSTLLDMPWPSYDVLCSDFTGDGVLNVLDIIIMIETILYGAPRLVSDISYAMIDIEKGQVTIDSDGYISGVQMIISHGKDFNITLTENAVVADYKTSGNITSIVIAGLEGENLFSVDGDFIIENVIAGNSSGEVVVGLPSQVSVSNAYPNPFNPETTINFQLSDDANISIKVYSIQGTNVATLTDRGYDSGYHSITWDASFYPSGLYLVRTISGSYMSTQKVMLLK